MNSIATFAVPKKGGGKYTKTTNSEPKVSASKEDGCTYGIDHLNSSRVKYYFGN